MKKILFVILVSFLLLAACQPKQESKDVVMTDELADVDGDAFEEIDAIDISDLDELDALEEELAELENMEI